MLDKEAVVHEWFKRREWSEDCTCGENDGDGSCWYHLTSQEKAEERARSLLRLLEEVT